MILGTADVEKIDSKPVELEKITDHTGNNNCTVYT